MHLIRRIAVAFLIALLALAPAGVERARATVNSAVNKTIVLGNGAQTQFTFNFIGVAAAYISVVLTDASGNQTTLTQGAGATQYQITLNTAVAGAIWGIGGTINYNPSGTPIPTGSTLTIFRTLPLLQAITLQNQVSLTALGKGSETAVDTGVMQGQQTAENIARAIVAPIVDATAPAPLPPIAQRANKGAAFDGNGNMVAGSTPASGVISSAMQPVVNAATLALGRTTFGLKAMAQEGIGAGLQDDGAGNARVNSTLVSVSTNQAVSATFAQNTYIATGPITFALARANTLWNGFAFELIAFTGPITFTPDPNDNFPGLAGGVSLVVPQGSAVAITTDAANTGTWYLTLVPQLQTPPQGYLTPCSATVAVTGCTTPNLVPTADVTAVSTLYYQTGPIGNRVPLFNGVNMVMVPVSELVLTLNSNHLANTLYDVCIAYNGGVPTVMTAPAWSTSTAGSGARGAPAAITRTNGLWTNNIAITGRNGASTFNIAANQCTMVATISIGSVAGQVNFHRTYGQSRRWDAWNFYNRQAITLKAGDPTATWVYNTNTIRAANGSSANSLTALTGLPEEIVSVSELQKVQHFSNSGTSGFSGNTGEARIGAGVNSIAAMSGTQGDALAFFTLNVAFTAYTISLQQQLAASYTVQPGLGINTITALEISPVAVSTSVTYFGQEANMLLRADWRG